MGFHFFSGRRNRKAAMKSSNRTPAGLDGVPNTGDGKTKRHLDNLRNISDKLIWEESLVEHSSIDGPPIKSNKSKCKSKYRVRTSDPSETAINSIAIPEPFQKLKPWLQCTSRMEELKTKPLVPVESNQKILVALPQHRQIQKRNSDSGTEATALCSAFEMLSFENLCNAGQKIAPAVAGTTVQPIKVIGHVPAEDDGFLVPKEISFANHNICGMGCVSNKFKDEEIHMFSRERTKQKKGTFMKRLLPPFKPPKSGKSSTRVMKVKVFMDPPKPLVSTPSIGNSTLTMPKELQRIGSNTTI